jgi:hypothetical protein
MIKEYYTPFHCESCLRPLVRKVETDNLFQPYYYCYFCQGRSFPSEDTKKEKPMSKKIVLDGIEVDETILIKAGWTPPKIKETVTKTFHVACVPITIKYNKYGNYFNVQFGNDQLFWSFTKAQVNTIYDTLSVFMSEHHK